MRTEALLRELYACSGAELYGITLHDFESILAGIYEKYATRERTIEDEERFFRSLYVQDLVLARACAVGNESAWEKFVAQTRSKMLCAARGITREESSAAELADSLYADLFGLTLHDGRRSSRLSSYDGRGSLDGWLRVVLAQQYVNIYRQRRRLEPLDDGDRLAHVTNAQITLELPKDKRLEEAVDDALASLSAEARLLLSAYYLDERTLAEIARVARVHESTISRRLEKVIRKLHDDVVKALIARGFDSAAAEEMLAMDVRDLNVDVRAALSVSASRSNRGSLERPRVERASAAGNRSTPRGRRPTGAGGGGAP